MLCSVDDLDSSRVKIKNLVLSFSIGLPSMDLLYASRLEFLQIFCGPVGHQHVARLMGEYQAIDLITSRLHGDLRCDSTRL